MVDRLIKEYVDDRTLIVTSRMDHPSVHDAVDKYVDIYNPYCWEMHAANVEKVTKGGSSAVYIDDPNFSYKKFIEFLNSVKFDNIFFISFGTHVSDGRVRDDKFFKRMYSILESYCDNVVKVLDDC